MSGRKVGDVVTLTKAMSIGGVRKATIVRIDGADVYVEARVGSRMVEAHRYDCEFV